MVNDDEHFSALLTKCLRVSKEELPIIMWVHGYLFDPLTMLLS
jgi:hypothetical protein